MTSEILDTIEQRALGVRMSMTELCIASGVAPSTITRWRNGQKPWVRTIRKLERVLNEVESKS